MGEQTDRQTETLGLKALAVAGRPVQTLYSALLGFLKDTSASELFAKPSLRPNARKVPGTLRWQISGKGKIASLTSLKGDNLKRAEESFRSQLESLADFIDAPKFGDILRCCLLVPSLDDVVVVDGVVQLTNWGFVPEDLDGDHIDEHFVDTLGRYTWFTFSIDSPKFVPADGTTQPVRRKGAATSAGRKAALSGTEVTETQIQSSANEAEEIQLEQQEAAVAIDMTGALDLLGLQQGAAKEQIDEAYSAKCEEIESRLEKAPQGRLKEKYQSALNEIEMAREVVKDDQISSMSALSATKLWDLPGLGSGADDSENGLAGSISTKVGVEIGDILQQRYEVRRRIGIGGMGVVFAAFDRTRGEEIAIKMMLPELFKVKSAAKRFLDEAKISSRLSHPNIVNVFDVQVDKEKNFLTMELLSGRTLREEIKTRKSKNKSFSAQEAVRIGQSLCTALSYAHEFTIHRDIKPENIWLGDDGKTVKVMDFGIAQLVGSQKFSHTSMAMGTAYYMAPEQMAGSEDVDHRADQFSLAVVIYELLAGRVASGRIKSIKTLRHDVPTKLSEALDRALESNPEDRFANMEAFAQNLIARGSRARRSSRVPALALRSRESSGGTARRFRFALAASLAGVAIVGGGLAMTFYGDDIMRSARHLFVDPGLIQQAKAAKTKAHETFTKWAKAKEESDAESGQGMKGGLAEADGLLLKEEFTAALEKYKLVLQTAEGLIKKLQVDAEIVVAKLQAKLDSQKRLLGNAARDIQSGARDAKSQVKNYETGLKSAKDAATQREMTAKLIEARAEHAFFRNMKDYLDKSVYGGDEFVNNVQGPLHVAAGHLKRQDYVAARAAFENIVLAFHGLISRFELRKRVLYAKAMTEAAELTFRELSGGVAKLDSPEETGSASGYKEAALTLFRKQKYQEAAVAYEKALGKYRDMNTQLLAALAKKDRKMAANARARQRAAVARKQREVEEKREAENQARRDERRAEIQRREATQARREQFQREEAAKQRQAENDRAILQGVLGMFGSMRRR